MDKKDCIYKIRDDDGAWICNPYCPREMDDGCPKQKTKSDKTR